MKFLTLTIIAIALLTNPAISQEIQTTDHMQEMGTEGMNHMKDMETEGMEADGMNHMKDMEAEGMEDMEGITDMKAEGMEEIKTEVVEGMACM